MLTLVGGCHTVEPSDATLTERPAALGVNGQALELETAPDGEVSGADLLGNDRFATVHGRISIIRPDGSEESIAGLSAGLPSLTDGSLALLSTGNDGTYMTMISVGPEGAGGNALSFAITTAVDGAPQTGEVVGDACEGSTCTFVEPGDYEVDILFHGVDMGTPPAPPASVAATPGPGHVSVTWLDESPNETAFEIYRQTGTASFTRIAMVDMQRDMFRDYNANAGIAYRYAVAAVNGNGSSALVAQAGAAVMADPDPCALGGSAGDSDGDGIADADEVAGWTVFVDETGTGALEARAVTSDPLIGDTDGDGLCDAMERAHRTDPRQADTDADGLDDLDELQRWASSPTNVDSDGDASNRGKSPVNSLLFDGAEAIGITSPTLVDTDGDALSDYQEIIVSGLHPAIADVPQLEMRIVGDTDLGVEIISSQTQERVQGTEATLEHGQSTEFSSSDTRSHEVSASASLTTSASVEAGFPGGVSAMASVEASIMAGYTYNQTSSVTETSASDSRAAYTRALQASRSSTNEVVGGFLGVGLQIRNAGDVAFELQDVVITALRRDPDQPHRFRTITTLTLSDSFQEGVALAPGQATGTLRAEANIPANVALDLLADPRGLFFEIASFRMLRSGPGLDQPVDNAFLEQVTNKQTALVQIDYGNNTVLRHRVATNVARENGSIVGVRLADVLDSILGLPYETATFPDPMHGDVTVLTSLRNPVTGNDVAIDVPAQRVWMLIGTADTPIAPGTSFDDVVLRGGDELHVMYVRDADRDGLFARQEALYGTSDSDADSDGDGVSDGDEVRTDRGWRVFAPVEPYRSNPQVYANPTLADADADGLGDAAERNAGTDPNVADTDADGFCDGLGDTPNALCVMGDEDPIEPLIGNRAPMVMTGDAAPGETVSFQLDASDYQGIATVVIHWGDGSATTLRPGSSSLSQRVSHTYQLAPFATALTRTYSVTITATDVPGESTTTVQEVFFDCTLCRPLITLNATPLSSGYVSLTGTVEISSNRSLGGRPLYIHWRDGNVTALTLNHGSYYTFQVTYSYAPVLSPGQPQTFEILAVTPLGTYVSSRATTSVTVVE